MKETNERLIEKSAPGVKDIDRSWMTTFWETFSDCVIEMDTQYTVLNLLKKANSTFTIDIAGKNFFEIPADKEKAFVDSELSILKSGEVPFRRFTFLSKLGRYYRWTLIPIYKDGVLKGFGGIAIDVTTQSLNEITLYWQRAIIEEGSDFVSIAEVDGRVLYTNSVAYKMTGYDSASGEIPLDKIFNGQYLEAVLRDGHRKTIESGSWSGFTEITCKDGKKIPVEHNMFSIRNDKDETILIATVIRDITEFVEHEKKMEEARKAAEAASIAKSEFLSRMSHEIRTPMNAIIGMINIGRSADDLEKKNYCFQRADAASKHLLGVINDILDMSKIEANKFELSYSEFDFEQTLKNIVNMANIRAEEKKQNFIVDISEDVPLNILGDELRLSQVITNLLTNAIKFTPEKGSITLKIDKLEESDAGVVLRIEVADSGIGISKEQQAKLFTSFNQADSGISQKFGGTGLGLAISKRIIEMMGGYIWIESELGRGAKFIFTIKVKKTKGKARTKLADNVNRANMRILVVDDSEETRSYFTHIMKANNLSCDAVAGGPEAVYMIENSRDKPYNIFFVDWIMPEMDGIQLTRKIKEINGESSIVIMISAHDWNTVEKEAVSAGVRHFISKPLFPSALINAINICIGSDADESSGDAEHEGKGLRYNFKGHTLLIAEDVEINKEIMSAILEETEVSVDYADNGRIAVSMFKDNPEKYSLILMDINMPEMDGYEATRIIRSLDLKRAKEIKIIAMTANVFREDIEKCLECGMNDHTGKPVDAAALFEILAKYL